MSQPAPSRRAATISGQAEAARRPTERVQPAADRLGLLEAALADEAGEPGRHRDDGRPGVGAQRGPDPFHQG
jgi:hypothetical protein